MNKCPVCIIGNLRPSGSHAFCDNCGFVLFIMTPDYLDVSAKVLGVLLSNTKFTDRKSLEMHMLDLIKTHIPQLQAWLGAVANGVEEVVHTICDGVLAHAINLQIKGVVLNEEKSTDMVCRCGNTEHFTFPSSKLTELICDVCDAAFSAEPGGSFKPVFQCKCHSITCSPLDEETQHIVVCNECSQKYVVLPDGSMVEVIS